MASFITNEAAKRMIDGTLDFLAATVKARLCVAGTPDKDDTAMTGHTAATGSTDETLGSKTVTKNTTTDRIILDGADLSWTGLGHTGNATHVYFYADGADDAARLPIAVHDITDQSLTGATQANYAIPADGVAYLQQ